MSKNLKFKSNYSKDSKAARLYNKNGFFMRKRLQKGEHI